MVELKSHIYLHSKFNLAIPQVFFTVVLLGISILTVRAPLFAIILTIITLFLLLSIIDIRKAFVLSVILLPLSRSFLTFHTGFFDLTFSYIFTGIIVLIWIMGIIVRGNGMFSFNLDIRRSPMLILLFLLFAYVLSAVLSYNIFISMREVIQLLYYVLLVFVTVTLLNTEYKLKKFIGYWYGSLVIISIFAIVLFLFVKTGAYPPKIEAWLTGGSIKVSTVSHVNTMYSAMSYKRLALGFGNAYQQTANFILIGLLMNIAYFIRKRNLSQFGILLMFLVCLLFSYTRSAWLAFSIGVMFIMVQQKVNKNYFLLFFIIGILVYIAPQNFLYRLFSTTDITEGSVRIRLELWNHAWALFQRHPLFGVGPGAMKFISPVGTTHSAVVQILVDTGILGIISFIWLTVAVVWKGIRAMKMAPVEMSTTHLAILGSFVGLSIYNLFLVAIFDWYWVLLGALITSTRIIYRRSQESIPLVVGCR